jgi:hypothetical protein
MRPVAAGATTGYTPAKGIVMDRRLGTCLPRMSKKGRAGPEEATCHHV